MLPILAIIGLLAGMLGGMLGVGGSIVLIPALTLALGPDQHLYQAAAMIVNVAVSISAARRHHKAGAIQDTVLIYMLPAAVFFILLGVAMSNLPIFRGPQGGIWLGRLLAIFLLYVAVNNAIMLRKDVPTSRDRKEAVPFAVSTVHRNASVDQTSPVFQDPVAMHHPTAPLQSRHVAIAAAFIGMLMGLLGGLFGIGGGVVAVPLQQTLLRLPLRNAIANSSVVICFSAAIGATFKNASLAEHATIDHPLTWASGLLLAAMLAPTAWLGGRLGATLTHTLPIRAVRLCFIALMLVAAARMLRG
jgi:hypothetical protein